MNDLNPSGKPGLRDQRFDHGLITDGGCIDVKFPNRVNDAFCQFGAAVVAAHGVNDQFHMLIPSSKTI